MDKSNEEPASIPPNVAEQAEKPPEPQLDAPPTTTESDTTQEPLANSEISKKADEEKAGSSDSKPLPDLPESDRTSNATPGAASGEDEKAPHPTAAKESQSPKPAVDQAATTSVHEPAPSSATESLPDPPPAPEPQSETPGQQIKKRSMQHQGGEERYGGGGRARGDDDESVDVPKKASAQVMARRKIAPLRKRRG